MKQCTNCYFCHEDPKCPICGCEQSLSDEDIEQLDEAEDEEHANSSAANYKDYMAEERATTDRESD